MDNKISLKSPTFFVFLSFAIGVLNFLDSFARLMYSVMIHASYPLEVYLKPIFFLAQAVILILFLRSVRSIQKTTNPEPTLSHLITTHIVLTVAVILLYVDFQLSALAGMNTALGFLQLAFYLVYLVALSGTSFWFALKIHNHTIWKWFSIVFVLLGLVFATAFLEPMFFWSQNYAGFAFPGELTVLSTYAPLVLMFLAAMSAVAVLFRQTFRNPTVSLSLSWLLFVPAFLLPLFWDGYRDGIVNFVIRDVVYLGLGYSSFQWFSVSFLLMALVAYVLVLRELLRRSDHSLAFSLIILGVASFPWNGIVPLRISYSSIPGNVTSLGSIITGALMLESQRKVK